MAIIQNLEAFVQSYPAGLDSVTDLQLSQNENGRQIRFTIGGVTIPAGSVATISGTKPDGVVYSNTGTIEGADTVIFDETKTIIHELSKYEVDEKVVKIIEEVAQKIDNDYLGEAINNSPKTVTVINYFSCYMVEFTPDMLQTIEPKYKDILQNYCIKFIVLAKELYNTAMELFTTIYDLNYTNIDTFINLSKNCGIQIQYAQSLYNMFKEFSTLLLKKKEYQSNIKYILQKLFTQQKLLWDKIIIQKSNELTSFYKVQYV